MAGVAAAGLALAALLLPTPAIADTVTGTIPVGTGSLAAALSADGSRLYVGSFSGTDTGSVTVVDTAAGTTAKFPTGVAQVVDLTLSADGTRLYVAHRAGVVQVIDTATKAVLATATPGSTAYGVALSPDGSRLFVSDFANARVLVLNSTSLLPVAPPIPVGPNPRAITLSPDGTRAYVADQGAATTGSPGSVSVIDVATNLLVTTVGTGGNGTWAVQPTPDGAFVYASNGGSNTITVIDAATNTVFETIGTSLPGNTLSQPFQLRFTPDGRRAYVSNQLGNSVVVIDTHAAAVVSSVPVGTLPTALRIAPDGLTAYVANQTSSTVSVIALDTAPAVTTTTLPGGTAGVAYTATVATSGRPAPTLSLTGGALPPGLSLAADGSLTGTPTAPGTFTFTVTASSVVSGIPSTAQRTLTLTVAPAVLVAADDDFTATPIPATGGTAGNVLIDDTLNGSPLSAADVTLALTADGGLAGASLAADGTLSIPAGATAGTHTLTYRACLVADPQNCDTATVTVRVLAAVVTPPAPPSGSAPAGSAPTATDPAPALASTGSDSVLPLGAAGALLVVGGMLIAVRRRRAVRG
jgi:LPXTG-motif cell wall-anchored protein